MAGFFDFLISLFKSEDKKDTSVVVKNYINGNNNQRNGGRNNNSSRRNQSNIPKSPNKQDIKKGSRKQLALQSVKMYSTGIKGKVYTDTFYKSINHNFGIEIIIVNNSSQTQTAKLGHCIYDEKGNTILNGNFYPKVLPHSKVTQNIYVEAKTFAMLKCGKYKSQLWLNGLKVQKVFFTVTDK